MRKYLSTMFACLMLTSVMYSNVHAEKNQEESNQQQIQQQPSKQPTQPQQQPSKQQPGQTQPEVKLTEQQKTELANLHKDILEKKKEMINKYVEFGVIPEEKGQMMISHFEKHYEMLEQNGFVWKMHPHHKGPAQGSNGQQ
jgi:polyribonucleotide nucleotidyltransferase